MKLKSVGLALATLLVGPLSGCNPAETQKLAVEIAKPAVDTAAVAEAIKADVLQLVADFNAKDSEKAVSHDAPDYVGMFHGMPNVIGPEADLALTKMQVADPNMKLSVSDEKVDVPASGEMAVYRATYAYTFTDEKTKKPTTEVGNWLLGYKVQPDGSWKLSWGVVSDTGPAAASASNPG